ncbi:MAG: 50S ribosomal protein L30 [Gammaproteobacteria bacterium]|jgi:large subunit ribosomal protein L30|nr:50S ribosomal protein L30 [Gammaproteobacteria bacterium]
MAKKNANKTIKVTLVRSRFGRLPVHRACLAGLGLRRMHNSVELTDTPSVRGMINKISYMLKVEDLI